MLADFPDKVGFLGGRDIDSRVPVGALATFLNEEECPAGDHAALALVLRVCQVLPLQLVVQSLVPGPAKSLVDAPRAEGSKGPVLNVVQDPLPLHASLRTTLRDHAQGQLCKRRLGLQPSPLAQALDARHHVPCLGPGHAQAPKLALGDAREQRPATVHRSLCAELSGTATWEAAVFAKPGEDLRSAPIHGVAAQGVLLVAPRAAVLEVSAPLAPATRAAELADLAKLLQVLIVFFRRGIKGRWGAVCTRLLLTTGGAGARAILTRPAHCC
mmetsp:Transcript_98490/g.228354  ORF Transcript_98490/g.228354 Transcript_98490/m.228354 type:complete len:271 (-) Transcript_98490:18-830(-)